MIDHSRSNLPFGGIMTGLFLEIPGWKKLELTHLFLDMNGTLALDGVLCDGVEQALNSLTKIFHCHVITADTHGTAKSIFKPPIELNKIAPGDENQAKLQIIQSFGVDKSVAIGNGANDAAMIKAAGLGIAIMGPEGLCPDLLRVADILAPDPLSGLELLLKPKRLLASLRR